MGLEESDQAMTLAFTCEAVRAKAASGTEARTGERGAELARCGDEMGVEGGSGQTHGAAVLGAGRRGARDASR